jgi:hypothetical protein
MTETGRTEEEVKAEQIEILTESCLKTVKAVIDAILSKDIARLSPPLRWLHTGNPHAKSIFKELTGVNPGKTDKSTAGFKEWAKEEEQVGR